MTVVTADQVRSLLLSELDRQLHDAGIEPATLSDDFDLFGEGVIDSLGVIELMAAVEGQFEVDTDWEDYDPEEILVVGAFCKYVEENSTPAQFSLPGSRA